MEKNKMPMDVENINMPPIYPKQDGTNIKKHKIERLNDLGRKWCALRADYTRSAECKAIETEIFAIAFDLFMKGPVDPAESEKVKAPLNTENSSDGSSALRELGRMAEALPAFYTGVRNIPDSNGNYPDGRAYGRPAFSCFDASKQDLYPYMVYQLRKIAGELEHKEDMGERRQTVQTGKNEAHASYIPLVHDEIKIANIQDGMFSVSGVPMNDTGFDDYDGASQRQEVDAQMLSIVKTMLSLEEHLGKRQRNKTKLLAYRMFYTDSMTLVCKSLILQKAAVDGKQITQVLIPDYLCRRDVFKAMNPDFLDYYMTRVCRDAVDIRITPLKKLSALFAGGDDKEAGLPLDNRIYAAFIALQDKEGKTISVPRISQLRKDYIHFLREQLGGSERS